MCSLSVADGLRSATAKGDVWDCDGVALRVCVTLRVCAILAGGMSVRGVGRPLVESAATPQRALLCAFPPASSKNFLNKEI